MGGDNSENWVDSDDEPALNTLSQTEKLLKQISAKQNSMLDDLAELKARRRKFWKKWRCCKLLKLVLVIGAFFWIKSILECHSTKKVQNSVSGLDLEKFLLPHEFWLAMDHRAPITSTADRRWVRLERREGSSGLNIDKSGDIWTSRIGLVDRYKHDRLVETIVLDHFSLSNFATFDGHHIYYTCAHCDEIRVNDSRAWIKLDDDLRHVSAGPANVFAVDKHNQIWKFDKDGKNNEQIFGNLIHLAICHDNDDNAYGLCGISMGGNPVRFQSGRWISDMTLPDEFRGRALQRLDGNLVLVRRPDGQYTWLQERDGSSWIELSTSSRIQHVAIRRIKRIFRRIGIDDRSTRIVSEEDCRAQSSSVPPQPQVKSSTTTPPSSDFVFVYSKLTGANHYDVFLNKFGESELLVTFPLSLRHVSISDDLVTMVLGKKVFYQSWADRQLALTSNRMYDDEVGAFLTRGRSWFLERRVLTVDTTGSCFVEGKCDYYDEKRNNPTFHSHRFEAMDVSHDGSVAWGLATDDSIFEWDQALVWNKRSGKLVQVSVGSANHVWGINRGGNIFEYIGQNKWRHVAWNVSRGKPSVVRVSKEGHVLLLTKEGNVHRYDRSGNKWVHLSELKDIQHLYLL